MDRELSVVVQGYIFDDITNIVLNRVRKVFPHSEIILSTWKGLNVKNLNYDKLILNDDPGSIAPMYPYKYNLGNKENNINRQILSTLNGLRASTRKLSLKLRTDFFLLDNNIEKYWNKFNDYIDSYRLFNKRIITFSGDIPEKRCYFFYDFMFLGETTDLIKLFDVPLMSKELAEYFSHYSPIREDVYAWVKGNFKYIPEQYLLCSCIYKTNKNIFKEFRDLSDTTLDNIKKTKYYIINNFVCLNSEQIRIIPLKDSLYWIIKQNRCHIFTFYMWIKIYSRMFNKKINYRENGSYIHYYRKYLISYSRMILQKKKSKKFKLFLVTVKYKIFIFFSKLNPRSI